MNIKITFNKIEKIIPLPEDFEKELRVWQEFAGMCLDEFSFNLPKHDLPIFLLPKDVQDSILKPTEMENQYNKYDKKMENKLISFIELHYNTKVKKKYFVWESFETREKEKKQNISDIYSCNDYKK
jgi:hypothetical protein